MNTISDGSARSAYFGNSPKRMIDAVENLGYSYSNDPVEVTRFQADTADAMRAIVEYVRMMTINHDRVLKELDDVRDEMSDLLEGFRSLKEDSEYIFNKTDEILQAKRGERGSTGQAGPPGPEGPIARIDTNPLYLEQIERIKDLEDRIEELAEAIDDIEDK